MTGVELAGIISSALMSLGTLVGVLVTTSRHNREVSELIDYRVGQLEKKQDKHNCVIERMFDLEKAQDLLEERQRVANHRIDDLEKTHNKSA